MHGAGVNENDILKKQILSVIVGSDLKWREHADRKANRTEGMLKRTFKSREPGYRKIDTLLW